MSLIATERLLSARRHVCLILKYEASHLGLVSSGHNRMCRPIEFSIDPGTIMPFSSPSAVLNE